MINEMETISITYRGIVHKLTEYEKLVDTIEMIYTIYISINYKEKYITAVFEKNVLKNEKIESIKNVLASYMESPYTEEIYTMDKEETPLLYAAKINPSSSFKTLRVLSSKTIN